MSMLPVFYVILFFGTEVIREVITLKDNEPGVCLTKISSQRTKRVTYTKQINKWCGRRKCLARAYKIQPYVVTSLEPICCSGYQYRGEQDDCIPLCSTGCAGGACVAPEVCRCDPPSVLHPDHPNTCVQPTCDPPCIHGACVANNTCKCDPEFEILNATICAPKCQTGYTLGSDLECAPICENCTNGNCVAPNDCRCLEGYAFRDDVGCQPVCDECGNATCTAPKVCTCFEGYSEINSTHCTPICDSCTNGICRAPNVCTCSPGFSLQNGTCEPQCNDCNHGHCSGPNTCVCFEEYVQVNSTCIPKCSSCDKGLCEGECVCESGYKYVNGSCQPVCDVKCENGRCTAPNECLCDDGYMKNETKPSMCYKPCEKTCEGTCTAHGECLCNVTVDDFKSITKTYRCNKGKRKVCSKKEIVNVPKKSILCCGGWFFQESTQTCVPEVTSCDPPCHNAQCTSTNNCTCDPGLVPVNNTHCGPACPTAFYNNPNDSNLTCISKCSNECVFADCTDYDTCTCLPGYIKHTETECKPDCAVCEFGTCTAPNICKCNEGYKDNHDGKCRPVCDKCEHGECVEPNVCKCDKGYTKKDNGCVPVCDEVCQNGYCIAPNKCNCTTNYVLHSTDKFKCEPICEQECINASCVAPNKCQCNEGFEKADNWTCRPVCESCNNGVCVAPETCACNTGYVKNVSNVCHPVCKNCTNGRCVAPDTCDCNPGFQLNEEVCAPICEDACVNASCVLPNKCECLPGYQQTNMSNACAPVCEDCYGECVAPNTCRCFKTINGTCAPPPPINCKTCNGTCTNGECVCTNGTACQELDVESDEFASAPTLAGLQLTWMLGGAVALLLTIIMIVVFHRMWKQRQSYDRDMNEKSKNIDINNEGSIAYTVSDTLMRRRVDQDYDDVELSRQQVELLPYGEPEDYVERM